MILSSEQARLIPSEVRVLLAQLELISHGSTASWNPAGGHSEPSPVPFGESAPPHLVLRERYLAAVDDAGRLLVVREMHVELAHTRRGADRSKVVGETPEQETKRLLKDGEGFDADVVARRFNTTPTRVRKLRLADGRGADNGRKLKQDAEPEPEGRAEALRMKREAGMSVRQIAMVLGQPKSTVNDWLNAA